MGTDKRTRHFFRLVEANITQTLCEEIDKVAIKRDFFWISGLLGMVVLCAYCFYIARPDDMVRDFHATKPEWNVTKSAAVQLTSAIPFYRQGTVRQPLQIISLQKIKLPNYVEEENALDMAMVRMDKVLVIPKSTQPAMKLVA